MAWKEFQFFEPYMDGGTGPCFGKTVPQQLDDIEKEGWDIRFVNKEGQKFTVLAKKSSFPRSGQ